MNYLFEIMITGQLASDKYHYMHILNIFLSFITPNLRIFQWCSIYITINFKALTAELT